MFSSKEEFAKAMIDGRRFRDCAGNIYFVEWCCGVPCFVFIDPETCLQVRMDASWDTYSKVTEVLPWYERIPEQGVLCWVWDDQIPDARVIVIRSYEPSVRYPYNSMWGNAKPLTLDEAKQFIVEE